MENGERLGIEDQEKKAKTDLTDRLPKAQTEIESQEETVRNIQDQPAGKKPATEPEEKSE